MIHTIQTSHKSFQFSHEKVLSAAIIYLATTHQHRYTARPHSSSPTYLQFHPERMRVDKGGLTVCTYIHMYATPKAMHTCTPPKEHNGCFTPATYVAIVTHSKMKITDKPSKLCYIGCCSLKLGFANFCSEYGSVTTSSFLGSRTCTLSGRGFFGPVFPVGS